MVDGADSTVLGITQGSPSSGERVGEHVQGESVSERQGTSYSISCTCHNAHILSYDMACMHKHVVIHTTYPTQTSPVAGTF